jgi:NAD(P)-dependent dehydrogenase (short-subunit alcohol dehydrogenase family)
MPNDTAAPWNGPLAAGRVALVTGGAGSIGAASCRALADHGADIVVADIDASRTADVVADIEKRGRKATGIVMDLTPDGAAQEMVRKAIDAVGRVDILVNNLGHHLALAKPYEASTPEDWDRLYRINLLHVLGATHAALPGMLERGWGRVINFSSVEGIRSMPQASVYTAFKGALDSFTKSLGVEVAGRGVRVNCVAVDKTRSYQVHFYEQPEEYDRHIPIWVPAGHLADAEQVASVVLFLASELSEWVVGQTIPADGGTLAAGGWYRTPAKWTNSPLLHQYFESEDQRAQRPPNFR